MKQQQDSFEFLDPNLPKNHFEMHYKNLGFSLIAGVDEVGRGSLAGPVVAAAVVFPEDTPVIDGIEDSKKLSSKVREELVPIIYKYATCIAIGIVEEHIIDKINILQASRLAMKHAVCKLNITPQFLLIDGINKIDVNIPQKTIKKGDSLSQSIAAASIVAKVKRDQMMDTMSKEFPEYHLEKNKGYASEAHLNAIKVYGPQKFHRRSFSPIKELLS